MLQTGTVEKRTYTLLKRIMEDPVFKDYFLVGGTASALQMGHRKSIDLDLFTRNDIDVDELQNHLKKSYEFQDDFRARNTLKGKINGVSIDCIKYDYPLLKPLVCESNIRILSLEDISAMKLSSVTDNGSRITAVQNNYRPKANCNCMKSVNCCSGGGTVVPFIQSCIDLL